MDKNFGSGPVGSKLDQKGIIQDGRNIKGQKKNMNKDFLPSQVRRSLSVDHCGIIVSVKITLLFRKNETKVNKL